MQYWYNVDSGEVESDETKSQGAQVMGPYPTADDAGRALQSARERTEQWDADDREWGAAGSTKG
ncbi:methionine aminopeptidase [Dermatophilaceae bacterium Soc4.6]